jgi:hypothetical protein
MQYCMANWAFLDYTIIPYLPTGGIQYWIRPVSVSISARVYLPIQRLHFSTSVGA